MALTFNFSAEHLLDVARSQLGVTESPAGSNKQPYSAFFHRPPEAWCVDFGDWVIVNAGGQTPFGAANVAAKAWAQKNGCWVPASEMPKVGDFALMDFPGEDHSPNHFTIVETVHGLRDISTIEGNTDEAGGRTGGKVMRKHRTSYIDGYIRPTYQAASAGNGDDMPYIARLNKGFKYGDADLGTGFCTYVAGPVRTDNPSQALIDEAKANGRQIVSMGPLEFKALLDSTVTNVHRMIAQGK